MRLVLAAAALTLLVAPAAAKSPKLTSATTPIYPSKQCKTIHEGGEGEDPVLKCPGKGGYRVEESFSAEGFIITLTKADFELTVSGILGTKVEWRLAGGTPIAIIVDNEPYDRDDNGEKVPLPAEIFVRGLGPLKGLEKTLLVKDSKTPKDARAAAIALVDAEYAKVSTRK